LFSNSDYLSKYKHIFFDLDRTLWDFEKNSTETLRDIISEFSLSVEIQDADDFIQAFNYYNNRLWEEYREGKIKKFLLRQERFRLLLNRYGIKDKDIVARVSKYYLDKNPAKTALIENAKETLEYLSGKYKLHIITNGFYDVQLTKLIKSGISRYFTKVFTSDRIGRAKPNADIFEYAVRSLHAHKEECVMIGDDEMNDIIGARNAKIDQVFFNPTGISISVKPTFEIRILTDLMELF
jgi:putative hydrolase of the HAD superfamily